MTWPIQHLTAEDLDAFHSASLSPRASQHIEECADCRTMLARDRALVQRLESLPTFAPRADLAERVLAQVAKPVPARTVVRRPRVLALAAAVLIGIGTSVVWSLFNRPLLTSWLDRGAGALREFFWGGFVSVAQSLTEQPWPGGLQQFAGSGARVALLGGALLIGYVGAIVALRRLLRHPVPVSQPGW